MNPEQTKRIAMTGWALHTAGLAVVLVTLVVFYSLVYCQLHDQKRLDTERSEQLSLLLASSAEVQREQVPLRQELKKLQESIASTRSRLPNELQEKEFIGQLNKTAQQTGLEIMNHRITAVRPGSSISSAEIRFHCNGSYASICKFLNEVHQIARVTEISKLDLESEINSSGYPFQVTFVLYYGAESNDTEKG